MAFMKWKQVRLQDRVMTYFSKRYSVTGASTIEPQNSHTRWSLTACERSASVTRSQLTLARDCSMQVSPRHHAALSGPHLPWAAEVLRAFLYSPKLCTTLQWRKLCRHMPEILCYCPRLVQATTAATASSMSENHDHFQNRLLSQMWTGAEVTPTKAY